MKIENFKIGDEQVTKLEIPIPKEATKEEIDFVIKHRLIPVEDAFALAENAYNTDIKDTIKIYEQNRKNTSLYIGTACGTLAYPGFIKVGIALMGVGWLSIPIAAIAAVAFAFVLNQAIDSTTKLIEFNNMKKYVQKLEESDTEDKPKTGE